MRAYVQYLDYSPVTGKLYEPCGDRSVVILDGRRTLPGWIDDALECNGYRRPVYPHFQIMRGDFHHAEIIYSTVK